MYVLQLRVECQRYGSEARPLLVKQVVPAAARRTSVESAINYRPPSNIGRAYVIMKEAKRKFITASER